MLSCASVRSMQRRTGALPGRPDDIRAGSSVPPRLAESPSGDRAAGRICGYCKEPLTGPENKLHSHCKRVGDLRRCVVCLEPKPVSAFYKNGGFKDGIASRCKVCSGASTRALKAAKREPCPCCGQPKPDGRAVFCGACLADGDNTRCLRCHEMRPNDAFSCDRRRASGKYPWCKRCQAEYAVARSKQDESDKLNGRHCPLCDTAIRGKAIRRYCSSYCKNRAMSLSKNFRLTVPQYRSLVDATGGECPICEQPTSKWHVDHDHSTGLVTGVVCAGCNVGALARTFHDVEFVKRLLGYLEQTPASRLGIEAVADERRHQPAQLHRMWEHSSRRAGIVP